MTRFNLFGDGAKPPVVFLLAVWGETYIEQFLALGLRSLLAPGNIPAVAAKYDCTFTFLTRDYDRPVFEKNPIFETLKKYCAVEFIDIADIIFNGNGSATVTMAYERGMRSRGQRMRDTYFIYLVSDYIMADGSLTGLMKYMAQGYSGVTAGNFQIIEENCHTELATMTDAKTGILALPPRDLMAYAFPRMHPITIANMAGQTLCHSTHSNRIFWRVDDHTIIGRFYLRHMLCIRPEVDDYIIGASCDYSFIPEMCPSGKVAHIADSDEYCVVECQPFTHERNFIRSGGGQKHQLARSLSEWTTAEHRGNARVAVIFHSRDIPDAARNVIIESERYIADIDPWLTMPPCPARGHPYWISCIESVRDDVLLRPNSIRHYRDGVFMGVFGSPVFGQVFESVQSDYRLLTAKNVGRFLSLWRRIWIGLTHIGGHFPHVYPWHPRWRDYHYLMPYLRRILSDASPCLFVAVERTALADWIHERYGARTVFLKMDLLLLRPVSHVRSLTKNIRRVFGMLPAAYLEDLGSFIRCCEEILPEGGEVCLWIYGQHPRLRDHLSAAFTCFVRPRVENITVRHITGPLRPALDARYFGLVNIVERGIRLKRQMAWRIFKISVLGLCYLGSNLMALVDRKNKLFPVAGAIVTATVKPQKK